MLRNKVFAALAAIALSLLVVPAASASAETPADATGMTTATVEYKGTVTTLATLEKKIGETHCHDGKGKGKLTCFATEREADLDLLAKGGLPAEAAKAAAHKWGVAVPQQQKTTTKLSAAAGVCHPWVTLRYFDGYSGSGSSINLYCDYGDLGQVGWDNRANSAQCYVCSPIQHPEIRGLLHFQNTYYQQQLAIQQATAIQNISANIASSERLSFY